MKSFSELEQILFPEGAETLPTFDSRLGCVGRLPPEWNAGDDEDEPGEPEEELDEFGEVVMRSSAMPEFLLLFPEEEIGYQPEDLVAVLGEELASVDCLGSYVGGDLEGSVGRLGDSILLNLQFTPSPDWDDQTPGFAYALALPVAEGLALAFLGQRENLSELASGASTGGMPAELRQRLEAVAGGGLHLSAWENKTWYLGT